MARLIEHPADVIVRERMAEDCICDTSGNTSTYDGSFCPRADCPVHGRNAEDYFKQFASFYRA